MAGLRVQHYLLGFDDYLIFQKYRGIGLAQEGGQGLVLEFVIAHQTPEIHAG